jgi:dTDP-4-dehydrorhamnose 3,5-epimerase
MLSHVRTALSDIMVLEAQNYSDQRGAFQEIYVSSKYRTVGVNDEFVQDNVSISRRGVVRGLHGDPEMSKLVYVLRGEVFDVAVDARRDSPSFGQWHAEHLSAENHLQVYIPRGCLHGFLALTDDVIFCYKQSAEYAPQREIGVLWNDPTLAIKWPDLGMSPILSEKDRKNRLFSEVFHRL